jgi:hypothetical protein
MGLTPSIPKSPIIWKRHTTVAEAKAKYVNEGTIREDCTQDELEFRVLLDDSFCIDMMYDFANPQQRSQLQAWKALHQMSTPATSHCFFGVLSCSSMMAQSVAIEGDIERARELQFIFDELFEELLFEFQKSQHYSKMRDYLAALNRVSPADFDFFGKLGSGAFGLVVSCRKRSTGAVYAMKIQPKAAVLHNNRQNHCDVMLEMLACTGCPSPFVCQAAYAFQTPKLVFLALPLYTGGDLRRALTIEPTGHFSHVRTQLYAVELAIVLMFFHDHGLIHRDLKPENVFIDGTGHLVVGDLGSVAGNVETLTRNSNCA